MIYNLQKQMDVSVVKKTFLPMLVLFTVILSGCNKSTTDVVYQTLPPVEEPEIRVSFYGVGDNLIHNCVYWQAQNHAGGNGYDFKPMYELVANDIKSADISYINQETLLGGTQIGVSSYPLFNSPQELGFDMIELGFDLFSHATNHVFDKGEKGVKNTYEFYMQHPEVTMTGINKKGEENTKIVERNGVKIAFLNYTYHTNGLSLSDSSEYYVPLANIDRMVTDVTQAKSVADFVVCLLHWGNEGALTPNAIQKNDAKALSDAGCDVIIGTHPHVIQPVEFVGNTLVIYSLGNYISAQNSAVNMVGGTVKFDFVVNGDEKRIENIKFKPVINHFNYGYANIKIIPFESYTPELAASHGVGLSYDYLKSLIEKAISPEYL